MDISKQSPFVCEIDGEMWFNAASVRKAIDAAIRGEQERVAEASRVAVLTEREACAKTAEAMLTATADHVAVAIRARE